MKELLNLPIKTLSSLGILDWGYSEESLPTSMKHYEQWVKQDLQGPLSYLSDHRKDLRRDIKNIYPEFKSALVFLFSYQEAKKWLLDNNRHEVAAYSLGFEGQDYHVVLKERLNKIFEGLKQSNPELKHFIALDAQPVLERDLAFRSGLGWFGKNSMLIHQKEGSYFIIGSLLLNQKLKLETSAMDIDHCGQCTACIDACPTLAIDGEARTIIASQCISTYTIEIFKEAEAPKGFDKSRGEFFGCDICQDVCPWNRKPLARVIGSLKLPEKLSFLKEWFFVLPIKDLVNIIEKETNRGLKRKLFGTAFDRPGKIGWLKNLKSILSNSSRNDS
jgi:epoxyqueuosine reductase